MKTIFHTPTLIDPASWEIIGLSAKETESPIGFFGSGLKFAIAILLRTGHTVTIHAGGDCHKFAGAPRVFRGKAYEVVTCNGKELGFTTDMGKTWEVWQAYRELVCNTLDEKGSFFSGEPCDEGTSIEVEGKEIADCLKRHDEYFVAGRIPIAEVPNTLSVYRGDGTIYYRGVKVHQLPKSKFSYQLHEHVDLNEDRGLKSEWWTFCTIRMKLCELTSPSTIKEIATSAPDTFEGAGPYDYTWGETFRETVTELWKTCPTKLSEAIVKLVAKKVEKDSFPKVEVNKDQSEMLEDALDFLNAAGYKVTAPIHLIENRDAECPAFVYRNEIYLTPQVFENGAFHLLHVLLEEHLHTMGYRDESRGFQTYLLKQIVHQANKKISVKL